MLYTNYDYRIPLFFPCIYLIFKYSARNSYFITFFIFVMPLDLTFLPLEINFLYIETVLSLLGRISIYTFLIFNLQIIKNYSFQLFEFNLEKLKSKNIKEAKRRKK